MCSLSLKFGDHPVQRARMRGFCSEREKQRLFLEEDQGRSQGGAGCGKNVRQPHRLKQQTQDQEMNAVKT